MARHFAEDPMLKGSKKRNGLPEDVIIKEYTAVPVTSYGNYPDDISGITNQQKGDAKKIRPSNQKY